MNTSSITADLHVELDETSLRLTHITPQQAGEEFDGAIEIGASRFLGSFWTSNRASLGLAETRVALQHLFGDTSLGFDDWKSSFCYLFRMDVRKRPRTSTYLVRVSDWKGGFDVTIYRPDHRSEGQAGKVMHDFVAEEFSRTDYSTLVNYLCGYLEGCLRSLRSSGISVEDFSCEVDNVFLVYGYENGEPFEREFEDGEEYSSECVRLRELTRRRAP